MVPYSTSVSGLQSGGRHFLISHSAVCSIPSLERNSQTSYCHLSSVLSWKVPTFQSFRALLWSSCNPCSTRNLSYLFFSFFLLVLFPSDTSFPSEQLVNMASNLPKAATGNSNDVGEEQRFTEYSAHLPFWQQNSCFPNGKSDLLDLYLFIHIQLIFWALLDFYPVRWQTAKVTEIAFLSNCATLW